MTVVATAWTIEAPDDQIMRVSREDGHVDFKWLCGEERSLTTKAVREAIANLELLEPHGVWLRLRDRRGGDFVAMVADDRFYAAANPMYDPDQYVSWPTLRELLQPPPEELVDEAQDLDDEPPSSRFIVRDRRGGLLDWLRRRR